MAEHPRNGGRWTEARYMGFIKSALRNASMRWPPKYEVKKKSWLSRGMYHCQGYKRRGHKVPVTLPPDPGKSRRVNNVLVDHIEPVVPTDGWTSWDDIILRMFCEEDGLQVLCRDCHNLKTADEREERKNKK